MNHSREFIRGFVESITIVMNMMISEHVHAMDPVKRVFAFMADMVTELHRTGDAVALLILTEMSGIFTPSTRKVDRWSALCRR